MGNLLIWNETEQGGANGLGSPDALTHLQCLVESTHDLIWSVGLDFALVTFNTAFADAVQLNFGTTPAAGMTLGELLPAARALRWPAMYRRALERGSFETEYVLADGRCLSLRLTPVMEGAVPIGVSVFGKEITEKRRAQQACQRYREIFDDAVEGIVCMMLNGEPALANRAFATMLRYDSPENMVVTGIQPGVDFWESPEDREKFLDRLKSAGKVRGYETRFRRSDGELIWVSIKAHLTVMESGLPGEIEAYVEDISERRKTALKLTESESRFQTAFEQAPVGMIQQTLDGEWVCNRKMARMLGYVPEELCGRSLAEITAPEDREKTERQRGRLLREEVESVTFEKRYLRRDGSRIWARTTASTERDSDGKPMRFFVLVEDISERKQAEQRVQALQETLKASEERYRTTFQQAAVGMLHTSFDGKILLCNDRFAQMLGYSVEELQGKEFRELTFAEDVTASEQLAVNLMGDDAGLRRLEKRYVRKDGRVVWAALTVSMLKDAQGRPLHWITVVEDIDWRKQAEKELTAAQEALRTSELRYRTVFETSADSICLVRMSDLTYVDVNQAFCEVMECSRDEVIGRKLEELDIWDSPADEQMVMHSLMTTGEVRNAEIRFRSREKRLILGLASITVMQLNGEPHALAITRDITRNKLAEEEIRTLAFYDSLTGLANRRLLQERLQASVSGGARSHGLHALVLIDLDDFKTVNDSLGHSAGDMLLRELAVRLQSCLRETDMVARLGGDEFVVVLEDLVGDAESAVRRAEQVTEKMLEAMHKPHALEGHQCTCSASAGISIFGDRLKTVDEVLREADIAMYEAKASGRNAIRVFSQDLQVAVHARATLEEELRDAIAHEEFVLQYQPQFCGGRLKGAEALVRWIHPRRGMLSPMEFIPQAEENGLILPLGEWVLETACRQIVIWSRKPELADISVSVNVSARQLHSPGFVKAVLGILSRIGADPSKLNLELTESILVQDIESTIGKMQDLKRHGVKFSIDDFGTGYSSLSYLKRLPINDLKIDRVFVRDIAVDPGSAAIAQTIIALSEALGLSVIAEGVENEEQRAFLEGLGCRDFQGYLFGRPVAVSEFETRFSRMGETALVSR